MEERGGVSDDPRFSQQHMMPPMGNRGKGMPNSHGNNMHPGMGQPGIPNQQPGMPGMSPSHQMMQGGPSNIPPGHASSNNMPGHNQTNMGHPTPPHGMTSSSMSPSSGMSGMPPNMNNGMGGNMSDSSMSNNPMGNVPSAAGGMPMQGQGQPQQPGMCSSPMQTQGMGGQSSVQSMPPMPGASASPNLTGSQMAGGAMGPPNQSVDPSTNQSKLFQIMYVHVACCFILKTS